MREKFPYERAAMILAEAEIFGDVETCKRWSITRQTLYRYRVRSQEDGELSQSVTLKKRMLLYGWQQDCAASIKKTLKVFDGLMEDARAASCDGEERAVSFAAVLKSVAGGLKIVGELKLAAEALNESDSSGEVSEVAPRSRQEANF
jgi:hypothetical protein